MVCGFVACVLHQGKGRTLVVRDAVGSVLAEEDMGGCGDTPIPRRVVSGVVGTNLCTPDKVKTRSPVVVRIAGGRVHGGLTGVGTSVVNTSASPFCNTPYILVILTGGGYHATVCSNDLIVRGLVLTTRTLKLKDY